MPRWLAVVAIIAILPREVALSQDSGDAIRTNLPPIILTVEGTNVWVQPFRTNEWLSAYPAQVLKAKDRGRTGADSRTSVRLSDLSVLRIGVYSEFEIQPLPDPEIEAEFSLWHGLMRLLNRDKPGRHRFKTPTATAATRGTEFVLRVEEITGRTVLTVFEGEAELSNEFGTVSIASGEQGIAETGLAPTRTAVIDARSIVQWCLYYPGILDPAELILNTDAPAVLARSLTLYRTGDLLGALAAYPAGRAPGSDMERVYLAALRLSVGEVASTEKLFNELESPGPNATRAHRLVNALRLMVDVVNQRPVSKAPPSDFQSPLATELLAESYLRQSKHQLEEALQLARQSVGVSPDFAFGWARVADLEFSFGRIRAASTALDKSLSLAPRNAQAVALRGFLELAMNRFEDALDSFDRAIELDGGLGNAWLGRGLCRIRAGQADQGRFDLQVAAALEPQRSVLRSYLGKAFANEHDDRSAMKELAIAEELDPNDPTPRLYSALLLRDLNRINEAVTDLEKSRDLNDNRAVYRSQMLLDQDRAVRGANLASVYLDAGLGDVSVREAVRAVNTDYANYSAHLFLANSYNELRDPDQINLRYETAWFSEYLLANLLSPVGAGTLSQSVSQQEYSRLFERNRFGFQSTTEYFSNGEWFQGAVQYGSSANSAYTTEIFYHSNDGQRPNNDLEQLAVRVNLKQQLGPQDGVYFRASYYNADSGDVIPYYSQDEYNPGLRTSERHEPWLLAGYHHEWAPGSHTLVLGGWFNGSFDVDNPFHRLPSFNRGTGGPVNIAAPITYDQDYHSDLSFYSGEVQQIWQHDDHTLVAGARLQAGEFDTESELTDGRLFNGQPVSFDIAQHANADLLRLGAYVYEQWQIIPQLQLIGGISYDWIQFPENHRYAPVNSNEETRDQFSPKAGFIWTPLKDMTIRGAYTRGLGGVSLDQSVRLEPSQVAGFNQAYRSIIPEAVAGANAAPTFEIGSLSFEQKIWDRTFFGLSGEILSSDVDSTMGVVDVVAPTVPGSPFSAGSTRRELDYRERTLLATANQLIGDEWSLGVRYRLSQAELDDAFPDVPSTAITAGGFQPTQNLESILQQVHLSAVFNHPSGFFSRAGAIWTWQHNGGYTPELPGDEFWHFNIEAGYRFAQRRAEIRVGLYNLTDQDYRLSPLNLIQELPRERTLGVGLSFNF